MRDNVRTFVQLAAETLPLGGPIYEFGSYLVEDQHGRGDLRGFFPGQPYVGCDMRRGPGVDRVEDLSCLSLPSGSAGLILCLDTLEHVFEVRRAVDEMMRVLAPGGALVVAAPLDFRIHEYPDDYWRITPSCLMRLLEPLAGRVIGHQGVEDYPHTVFGLGLKAPIDLAMVRGLPLLIERFQHWLDAEPAKLDLRSRWRRFQNLWMRGKGAWRRERDLYRAQFVLDLPGDAGLTACLTKSGHKVRAGA